VAVPIVTAGGTLMTVTAPLVTVIGTTIPTVPTAVATLLPPAGPGGTGAGKTPAPVGRGRAGEVNPTVLLPTAAGPVSRSGRVARGVAWPLATRRAGAPRTAATFQGALSALGTGRARTAGTGGGVPAGPALPQPPAGPAAPGGGANGAGGGGASSGGNGSGGAPGGVTACLLALLILVLLWLTRLPGVKPAWRAFLPEVSPA
jgi:hypothetical protein